MSLLMRWPTRSCPASRSRTTGRCARRSRRSPAPPRRAGRASDFAAWGRADREALIGELLADPGAPAGDALAQVLRVAARTHYADPGSWEGLGYRPMQPGTSWPEGLDTAPAAIAVDDLAPDYDVVVIGAGAGGGVAACVLAEAGRRVLLVERGESLARADLPRDHLRNARVFTGLERQLDPPVAGNLRFVGDVAVLPTEAAWSNNAMALGGGTRVYGAMAWRFCPEDFRMGSTYGEPFVDWPIGYDDVAPYYDRVEWELGVCGPDAPRPYDGARTRGYPMPPFAPNAAEPVLARGAEALGLATAAIPLLINSVPYGGRPACIRCGTCAGFACHADAKNGSHNTTIPRALATGRCDLAHRHRRHAADHAGDARSSARSSRGPGGAWRCGRATWWSARARSRPPGCCWPATSGTRTTRSAATCRATSTPAPSGSSTSSCRTRSGPGR